MLGASVFLHATPVKSRRRKSVRKPTISQGGDLYSRFTPYKSAMRYLGIDFGKKRVGLALSDESGTLAFPHSVLPNNKKLVAEVVRIAREQKVQAIIVGESKNLDGKDNKIMKDIEPFAEALHKETKLTVHLEPEFWSSVQAERWQGKTYKLDASAAAIILQSYLDRE